MDGKIEQYVCIKFCVQLGKSATETFEMLWEAFGEHSLGRTVVFKWHSLFKAGWVSVEDDKMTKHQQNDRKCWKNSRIRPQRRSSNNPWARRHLWDQLWSLPGDVTENLNICRIAPSLWQCAHPHVPENRVCD
jgi:hypothetical protein